MITVFYLVAMYANSGVSISPRFDPELNIPVASARSFFGNHSETVLMQAGKFPASPRPRAKRAPAKPQKERAAAWAMAAMLQSPTAHASPVRVPSTSMMRPEMNSPIA